MGTIERKLKEKTELRSLILAAAQKLFVEKGIEQTTLRNIAQAIEYSVGTVYSYFKDKNDILHELHQMGFRQLGGEMRVLVSVSDPFERVKAIGRIYLKFAVENPDMYDLMFTLKAPLEFLECEKQDAWDEGKATFEVLKDTVSECIQRGYFKGHEVEAFSFVLWSLVHGMASLHISQRIKGACIAEPSTILMEGYEEFVKMLEKKK